MARVAGGYLDGDGDDAGAGVFGHGGVVRDFAFGGERSDDVEVGVGFDRGDAQRHVDGVVGDVAAAERFGHEPELFELALLEQGDGLGQGVDGGEVWSLHCVALCFRRA